VRVWIRWGCFSLEGDSTRTHESIVTVSSSSKVASLKRIVSDKYGLPEVCIALFVGTIELADSLLLSQLPRLAKSQPDVNSSNHNSKNSNSNSGISSPKPPVDATVSVLVVVDFLLEELASINSQTTSVAAAATAAVATASAEKPQSVAAAAAARFQQWADPVIDKKLSILRALTILGPRGGRRTVNAILSSMEDVDVRVRVQALQALKASAPVLAGDGDSETALALLPQLLHGELAVRMAGLEAIGSLLERRNCTCRSETGTPCRRTWIRPEHMELVLSALAARLEDDNEEVPFEAERMLTMITCPGDERALRSVSVKLGHPQAAAREAALRTLSGLAVPGDERCVEWACIGFLDPEPRVRSAALELLGNSKVAAAVAAPKLLLLFENLSGDVRQTSLAALRLTAKRGDLTISRRLEELAKHPYYYVRRTAVEALGIVTKKSNQRLVRKILENLHDSDAGVRSAAVRAIVDVGRSVPSVKVNIANRSKCTTVRKMESNPPAAPPPAPPPAKRPVAVIPSSSCFEVRRGLGRTAVLDESEINRMKPVGSKATKSAPPNCGLTSGVCGTDKTDSPPAQEPPTGDPRPNVVLSELERLWLGDPDVEVRHEARGAIAQLFPHSNHAAMAMAAREESRAFRDSAKVVALGEESIARLAHTSAPESVSKSESTSSDPLDTRI